VGYVMNRQEKRNQEIVTLLADQYRSAGDAWKDGVLETVGVNVMGEGLLLRVEDSKGATLWDARLHDDGMCQMILADMARNMNSRNPGFNGAYTEKSYPVFSDGTQVGAVDIGYYGPYFFTDTDIQYLAAVNRLFLWVALAAAGAAVVLGGVMARQLTRPMAKVVEATQKIAKGDYSKSIDVDSSTLEIAELTTSVNRLAKDLERQDEYKKRLTADVAHELRTPIATLQSHLEAMIDGVWEASAERLASSHEEVVRLSRIVGDLEKLTRYEENRPELNRSRFDLSVLVRRIATNHESEFRNKGIELTVQAQPVQVDADEDRIGQVVVNLLSNAWKYTSTGGAAAIELVVLHDGIELRVADTGIGIAAEDLPRIFDRFYRTDPSRTRATGGTGIGLAIVKAIVEAHQGSIRVESRVGIGSTFTVTLPG